MHRILAILALVVVTCFVSIGGNDSTSMQKDDLNTTYSESNEIIEQYSNINLMSVAEILPDGGSNNAISGIFR